MDQSLCRVFCSTLLCSGGRVLVLPAWTIFIKVAAFFFKAFCFFCGGVKGELLAVVTLPTGGCYTGESESWKMCRICQIETEHQ